jgi:hypothetical protein
VGGKGHKAPSLTGFLRKRINMLHLKDKLVRITSYRGQERNRVARVVEVRDIQRQPILPKSAAYNKIERSRYLITIHDLTENVFRSYYHTYAKWEPLNRFSRLFWRLGKWFEEN